MPSVLSIFMTVSSVLLSFAMVFSRCFCDFLFKRDEVFKINNGVILLNFTQTFFIIS